MVDRPDDCQEVEDYLAELPEVWRKQVMLMPQGVELDVLEQRAAWLLPYCDAQGFSFCPRRQIEWFGAARGR